jgi:DNA adenine methylase
MSSARILRLNVVATTPLARPFLKWVGGKRQLVPELLKTVVSARPAWGTEGLRGHYYEPFLGGGALFFALRVHGWYGSATLGDSNDRLVRTYMGVRDDVEAVIEGLRSKVYDKDAYLHERSREIDHREDTDVAVWMIYLNKTGFNGLYRVNAKGEFNVPFGRYTNPTICDDVNLRACAKALHHTKFLIGDFEKTVRSAERGDLVYFDPPYVPVSKTANFESYTKDGFSMEDQRRLRDCAWKLRERGVHVILSNADTAAVRDLYARFACRRVEARRAVNSDASKRGNVGELIIT